MSFKFKFKIIIVSTASNLVVEPEIGVFSFHQQLEMELACSHPTIRQATGLDAWASRVKCPARFVSYLHEICICIYLYIWVVYSLCFFCCLFIIVTWWYVWCIIWVSGAGLGSIQFWNWNCSSIPIPIWELELELKLVELKMELELQTLELELKTRIDFWWGWGVWNQLLTPGAPFTNMA